MPLWARRAVAAQLGAWQGGLLWQQAASPLEVTGGVGLVHLLRALQEVRGWATGLLHVLVVPAACASGVV